MPYLFCDTPSRGLNPILNHLRNTVIPAWKQGGVFQHIEFKGDPPEGEATHSLLLVDPTQAGELPPPRGLTTYLYFTPSALVDSNTYNQLGNPHMGVAASGMIVGSLLNSLPPNPHPALFRFLRLMRSCPLGVVSPACIPHSRRESGLYRSQLRSRFIGEQALPTDICLLVTADGISVSPRASLQRAIDLIIWMRGNTKQVVKLFMEGLSLQDVDPLLLEGNDILMGRDLTLIPEIGNPRKYAAFDAAIGLASECYFPLSLVRAAACGLPTFAPGTHMWMEAISNSGTVEIPAPYFQVCPGGIGYTFGIDISTAGKQILSVLEAVAPNHSKEVRGMQEGALSVTRFSRDLLTLMGLA
jgi:hypothetical protein